MIKELLLLTITIVYIIDLSGFVSEMKIRVCRLIFRRKDYQPFSLKPFDCSLCVTWWVGIIYLYMHHSISLQNIAYLAMLSFHADLIKEMIMLIKDCIGTVCNRTYNIINKWN